MTTLLLILSAAAVIFMVFGLAFFYAGQTNERSVTNTLLMSFGALAIVMPLWAIVGHSIAFGDTSDKAFVLFQGAFAVIATALISGSIVQRMKFGAWMIFAGVWSLVVYSVLVQWTWSETGWLFNLGAIDLAGGGPIHIAAGISGAVLALILGNRIAEGTHSHTRNNVPQVILGAGILSFGWIFFNSGSVLDVNETTSLVALNTVLAASIGAAGWMMLDGLRHKSATALSGASGAVAGLVAITPSAAAVTEVGAIIIGFIAALAVYGALLLKNRFPVDDALDVAAFHAVAGMIGSLAIGLLGVDVGLFYGNGLHQLGIQIVAIVSTILYAGIITLLLALGMKYTVGIRVTSTVEQNGIDQTHMV